VEICILNSDTTELQRFLRKQAVIDATGLSESSIYELMGEGKFPKPVPLEGRRVAWLESEILEWQKKHIAARERGVKAKRTGIAAQRAEANETASAKPESTAA
jgi:prophage regulatory protein